MFVMVMLPHQGFPTPITVLCCCHRAPVASDAESTCDPRTLKSRNEEHTMSRLFFLPAQQMRPMLRRRFGPVPQYRYREAERRMELLSPAPLQIATTAPVELNRFDLPATIPPSALKAEQLCQRQAGHRR